MEEEVEEQQQQQPQQPHEQQQQSHEQQQRRQRPEGTLLDEARLDLHKRAQKYLQPVCKQLLKALTLSTGNFGLPESKVGMFYRQNFRYSAAFKEWEEETHRLLISAAIFGELATQDSSYDTETSDEYCNNLFSFLNDVCAEETAQVMKPVVNAKKHDRDEAIISTTKQLQRAGRAHQYEKPQVTNSGLHMSPAWELSEQQASSQQRRQYQRSQTRGKGRKAGKTGRRPGRFTNPGKQKN